MAREPILIVGATGQVGAELAGTLAPLGQVHTPNHAALDLENPDSIRRVLHAIHPRWIVNAAAYTAVDRAESESEHAFAINAKALSILGETAREIDAAVVHFSTDYVFSGEGIAAFTEDDETAPLNVYGASKLAGEKALAASGAKHLIFRTSWVFGAAGHNFLRTILRLAQERTEIRIVNDQFGAPTWSRDLARMTAHVISQCRQRDGENIPWRSGIYHATSCGETTWHGFASAALDFFTRQHPEVGLARLIAVPTSAYPTVASRPHNSRLNCQHLTESFNWRMMEWRDALQQVIAEL